eukprot:CAMPEP_0115119562 /NCGR_PEP_ID=MMETSP0227-20121206/45164_1 /TAXON_ID=89957 /ORGANISM="Polarella glacialis, Strain CCMP 1383" /LENGTH=583 /DNA_ID=CAMNT_0002521053 /DNA_START=107 /DNA_END=1857 /DNA_ORIENTATION=-
MAGSKSTSGKAPAGKSTDAKKALQIKTAMKAMKAMKCRAEANSESSKRVREASLSRSFASPVAKSRRKGTPDVHNSVIKLFASHVQPNYAQPWCSDAQTSSTSTAWPIRLANGALRLVTNAHSVEHASLVQVKRHSFEQKWVAKVLCIGPDCDLALLEVPSLDFWKNLTPLDIFPGLPKLQDDVRVIGYPTGGESLSVTQGVVSRIDLVEYAQSGMVLLGIQIDAAINSGNSGGPVVDSKGHCIGVAFQNLSGEDDGAENIGYVIPSEIVLHFLEDYTRNKSFTGFGTAGFSYQPLESPMLRESMGLLKGQSGVRVKTVDAAGASAGILQPDDVLLRVDGHQVGNDGSVNFARGRIPFPYLLQKCFTGQAIDVSILRPSSDKGSSTKLNFNIKVQRGQGLVNSDTGGPHAKPGCVAPRYLIAGGLVFVPLTVPFLASAFGENFAEERPGELSVELLALSENGVKESLGHEALVLVSVLASEVTIGYSDMEHEILDSFNGTKVENLKHLADLLDKNRDRYLRFQFKAKNIIALDSAQAKKMLPAILAQNMIPAAALKEALSTAKKVVLAIFYPAAGCRTLHRLD